MAVGADHRFIDALEQFGDRHFVGDLGSLVAAALRPSLRTEADAEGLVRRPAAIAPDAACFAGRDVSALAVRRIPAARAAVVASDFDDPWLLSVAARHPVEAVAAEIENPTPLLEVAVKCVKAVSGPIFGMRSGDDRGVAVEQSSPLALQIFVSRNVILKPDMLEPFDDIH